MSDTYDRPKGRNRVPRLRSSPAELSAKRWPHGVPGNLPLDVQQAVLAAGEFASRVRMARESRRWSRAALGRKAGLSPHVVGNVEDGNAWPDLITMSSLAKALGMSVRLMALSPDEAVAVTRALAAVSGLHPAASAAAPAGAAERRPDSAAAANALRALLAAWPELGEQLQRPAPAGARPQSLRPAKLRAEQSP